MGMMAIILNDTFIELGLKYLPAGLITIFVGVFIVLLLLGKLSDTYVKLKNAFTRKKKTEIADEEVRIIDNLNNHQYFNFMDFAIKYRIPKMKFKCSARTRILQKFLMIKCQVFYKRTKDLLDLNLNEIPVKDLEKIVLTDILDGIKEYEQLMNAEADTPEEKYVLDIVIDRFSNWHDKNVEAAYKVIENIFDSDSIYHDNCERMNGVLNVYLFAFVSAFTDAEKALYSINGELSGKQYKGQTIK